MMRAARNESIQLAAARETLAELEELNKDIPNLKKMLNREVEKSSILQLQLADSETALNQLRVDMQRLNDIYGKERKYRGESEQQRLRLSNDIEILNQSYVLLKNESKTAMEALESTKSQLEECKYSYSLEKNEFVNNIKTLKNQLDDSENAKREVSLHFWNIKEDTKKLQEAMNSLQAENNRLRLENSMADVFYLRQREHELMDYEDIRSSLDRAQQFGISSQNSIRMLQSDIRQLYKAVEMKDSMSTKTIEQNQVEISSMTTRISAMSDQISELDSVLAQERSNIEKKDSEIAVLKARYASICKTEQNNINLERENQRLKEAIDAKQSSLAVAESTLSQMMSQRELEISNYSNNEILVEALQAEVKELQSVKWEESLKIKEEIQLLTNELDVAKQSSEESRVKIENLKTEKMRYEEFVKKEIQNANHLGTVLKDELERRLTELGQANRDRNLYKHEVDALKSKVAELIEALDRTDAQFKQVIDDDRAKVQQDLKSKSIRCRNLENEKQELLAETSALMKQIQFHQNEKDSAFRQAEDASRRINEIKKENESLQVQVSDLTEELKAASRREVDLRERINYQENSFREDIGKLDGLIKTSKKTATTQVSEISEKLRIISASCEEQKIRIASLEASERKAIFDVEKRNEDIKILTERYEINQQQLSSELLLFRRDLSESRSKLKLAQEECTKREREVIAVEMEQTQLEAEIVRQKDRLRDAEER